MNKKRKKKVAVSPSRPLNCSTARDWAELPVLFDSTTPPVRIGGSMSINKGTIIKVGCPKVLLVEEESLGLLAGSVITREESER